MADQNQDVNLRIRATDYSKKTTKDVVDSLKELVKAQDAQIKSAEQGTAAAKDLAKGYDSIEAAAKALLGQRALIQFYEKQIAELSNLRDRAEAARAAQAAFAATMANVNNQTKEQRAETARLAAAVTNTEKAYQKLLGSAGATVNKLEALGINSLNTARAETQINAAVQSANIALERQEVAINGLSAAQARHKQTLADEAAAVKQASDAKAAAEYAERAAAIAQLQAMEKAAQASRDQAAAAQQAQQQRLAELNTRIKLAQQIASETAARQAQTQAILAAAAAAERNMRASAGAARGGAVAVAPSNLAGQIQDIQQPSSAALRSVTGLEASISKLQSTVANINGPIKNYRETLNEAKNAQQALSNVAGLIDNFRNQTAAVRAARAEYSQARDSVQQLIAAMRSGAAGDDIGQRMAAAQGALRAAANNLGNLTTQARASQAALREAGVNTSQLASAEQQLVSQATRATAAMNDLTAAQQRYGVATHNSSNSMLSWFNGGRTTLSMAQRLKGEVLSLTSSFVGLFAVIQGAHGVIESYNKSQAIQSRLLVAAKGDTKLAADEMAYINAQADRFGFAISTIGGAYAKFSIAAKTAGFTTQQTRFTFEGIAKAATAARLSTTDFEGVLKAFEQMLSKGKIQAEELRGQLGDRLPGAFSIAAKAAGKTTEEYNKLIELGQVPATEVIAIARELAKTYGVISDSSVTLIQAQARFENASERFKNAIADAGAAKAYSEFLQKLTKMISGKEGAQLAGKLAEAFKELLNVVTFLVDHMDAFVTLMKVLIGVKIITWAFEAAAAVKALSLAFTLLNAEIYAMTGTAVVRFLAAIGVGATGAAGGVAILTAGVGLLRVAFLALARAIPYVGAAILLYEGAKFIYDKTFGNDDEAKKKGEEKGKLAGEGFMSGIGKATEDPGNIDPSARAYQNLQDDLYKLGEKFDKKNRELRMKGAKQSLEDRKKIAREEVDEVADNYKQQLKEGQFGEMAKFDIQDRYRQAEANATLEFNQEQAKLAEEHAKKLVGLQAEALDTIAKARADYAAKLAKGDPSAGFEERLDANVAKATQSFNELGRKIDEIERIGTASAKKLAGELRAQLPFLVDQAKEVADRATKMDQLTRLETKMTNLVSAQSAEVTKINEQVTQREISETEGAARRNAVYAQMGPQIKAAGEEALKFATSIQDILDPTQYQAVLARINTSMTQNNEKALTTTNTLQDAERQLNDLLAKRDNQLKIIDAAQQQQFLTQSQADDERRRVFDEYKGQIALQAQSVLDMIDQIEKTSTVSSRALDDLKAKMKEVQITAQGNRAAMSALDKTIQDSIVNNGVKAFEDLATAMGQIVTKQVSIRDGFKGMLTAATNFFSSVMRDVAGYIAKQEILNALQANNVANMNDGAGSTGGGSNAFVGALSKFLGGSRGAKSIGDIFTKIPESGGFLDKIGNFFFDFFSGGSFLKFHSGGVVGAGGSNMSASLPASVFANAPRFHNGGLPGLKADEIPTILQKGEEVLTAKDSRHVLNGGGKQGGPAPAQGVRVVVVDDRAKVPEAMASAEGEKVIIETLRRNLPTIKSMLR